MNEVLLCGVSELDEKDRQAVVAHVMNKEHWARRTSSSSKKTADKSSVSVVPMRIKSEPENGGSLADSQALVTVGSTKREVFVIPNPRGDVVKANSLAGKTFVLTGVFPEVGGGAGLNLGKDRVKQMIQSFGGKVQQQQHRSVLLCVCSIAGWMDGWMEQYYCEVGG
jgi:hypothetical protein